MSKKPDNIFQAAAQTAKKTTKASHPAQSTPSRKPTQSSSKGFEDPETTELLARLKATKQKMRSNFEQLAEEMGMSPNEFRTWLQDKEELSPSEKALIATFTDNLDKQLRTGPTKINATPRDPEKDKKNRKAKTLGSRKNWISMH